MEMSDKFESISLEEINSYLKNKQEENLNLEFKTIKSSNFKSPDDKKNLASSISGFANSNSGIIIWGIDCRKNSDGVDCAVAAKEIQPLSLFLSRLNELTGDSVSPQVDGVKHKILETDNNGGFAVTFVPESDSGPHMAKLGENRYYKRSGDSFYVMEHFDIEDMFGRRKKPNLALTIKVPNKHNPSIIVCLKNTGRGSAKAPYLAFEIPHPWKLSPYGLDGNRSQGPLPYLKARGNERTVRFGANSNTVIHPDTELEIAVIYLGIGKSLEDLPDEGLDIKYEVTAENMKIKRDNLFAVIQDIFET